MPGFCGRAGGPSDRALTKTPVNGYAPVMSESGLTSMEPGECPMSAAVQDCSSTPTLRELRFAQCHGLGKSHNDVLTGLDAGNREEFE